MRNKIETIKLLDSGLSDESKFFKCRAYKIIFEDFKINKKPNIIFLKNIDEIENIIEYTYSIESTFNLIKINE